MCLALRWGWAQSFTLLRMPEAASWGLRVQEASLGVAPSLTLFQAGPRCRRQEVSGRVLLLLLLLRSWSEGGWRVASTVWSDAVPATAAAWELA